MSLYIDRQKDGQMDVCTYVPMHVRMDRFFGFKVNV